MKYFCSCWLQLVTWVIWICWRFVHDIHPVFYCFYNSLQNVILLFWIRSSNTAGDNNSNIGRHVIKIECSRIAFKQNIHKRTLQDSRSEVKCACVHGWESDRLLDLTYTSNYTTYRSFMVKFIMKWITRLHGLWYVILTGQLGLSLSGKTKWTFVFISFNVWVSLRCVRLGSIRLG